MVSKNYCLLFCCLLFCFLLLPNLALAKAKPEPVDCSDPTSFVGIKGKTIKECNDAVQAFSKKCEQDILLSTAGEVSFKVAEANCLNDLMNSELDKRLLPLKKSDPAQFKSEMKLQKAFNTASTKACTAYNACSGTMYKVTRAECGIYILQYRIKQIEQINNKGLDIARAKTGFKLDAKLSPIGEIKDYADLTCKMPIDVFKGGKILDNCSPSVTEEFTAALNGDCGDEENQ